MAITASALETTSSTTDGTLADIGDNAAYSTLRSTAALVEEGTTFSTTELAIIVDSSAGDNSTISTVSGGGTLDDFTCPLCLDLLLRPVTFVCGHRSCRACFIQLLESSATQETLAETGHATCPMGRCVLPPTVPNVDVELVQTINSRFPDKLAERTASMPSHEEEIRAAELNRQAASDEPRQGVTDDRMANIEAQTRIVLRRWRHIQRRRNRRVGMCFFAFGAAMLAFTCVELLSFLRPRHANGKVFSPTRTEPGEPNGGYMHANCTRRRRSLSNVVELLLMEPARPPAPPLLVPPGASLGEATSGEMLLPPEPPASPPLAGAPPRWPLVGQTTDSSCAPHTFGRPFIVGDTRGDGVPSTARWAPLNVGSDGWLLHASPPPRTLVLPMESISVTTSIANTATATTNRSAGVQVGAAAADEVRRAAGAYWAAAASAEHASIASFHAHSLELLSVGAPYALLRAAAEAALDETRHAALAYTLATSYYSYAVGPGSLDIASTRARAQSRLPLPRTSVSDVARAVVRDGCVHETVAAVEAMVALRGAVNPAVVEALMAIAADESNHAKLAWATADWAVETRPTLRPVLAQAAESMLVDVTGGAALVEGDTCTAGGEPSDEPTKLHAFSSSASAVRATWLREQLRAEGVLSDVDRAWARSLAITRVVRPAIQLLRGDSRSEVMPLGEKVGELLAKVAGSPEVRR